MLPQSLPLPLSRNAEESCYDSLPWATLQWTCYYSTHGFCPQMELTMLQGDTPLSGPDWYWFLFQLRLVFLISALSLRTEMVALLATVPSNYFLDLSHTSTNDNYNILPQKSTHTFLPRFEVMILVLCQANAAMAANIEDCSRPDCDRF